MVLSPVANGDHDSHADLSSDAAGTGLSESLNSPDFPENVPSQANARSPESEPKFAQPPSEMKTAAIISNKKSSSSDSRSPIGLAEMVHEDALKQSDPTLSNPELLVSNGETLFESTEALSGLATTPVNEQDVSLP